jgi:hypothetical protein
VNPILGLLSDTNYDGEVDSLDYNGCDSPPKYKGSEDWGDENYCTREYEGRPNFLAFYGSWQWVSLTVELEGGYALNRYVGKLPSFRTSQLALVNDADLNEGNRNGVSIQDGEIHAAQTGRIYVDNLKENCKKNGDDACYWSAYIYSDPVKLSGYLGAVRLAVLADENGRYYVDATLPESYSGDHKIALYDENDEFAGWTPATISDSLASTGAPLNLVLFSMLMMLSIACALQFGRKFDLWATRENVLGA